MTEEHLRLPQLLDDLIVSGRWPRTPEEAQRQMTELLVDVERIRAIDPDESSLYLYPPPFRSVESSVALHEANGWTFWNEYGALSELDPSLALILGDFGLGSDSPLLLDYRNEPEPAVLKLALRTVGEGPPFTVRTSWVRIAESFDDLATRLDLV